MNKYILIFITFLAASSMTSPEAPWKLRLENDGIRVFTRPTVHSSVEELKGECVVDAPVEVIWQVFLDVDSYTEWVGDCRESRKFNCSDIFSCTLYYMIGLPWPVANRDVVLRSSVDIIDADTLIASVSVPESSPVPLRPGCVRMTRMKGRWIFRRLADSRTYVSMESWADPAGNIPAFIINHVSVSVPFTTLKNLRSMVNKERYKKAAKEFDYRRYFKNTGR